MVVTPHDSWQREEEKRELIMSTPTQGFLFKNVITNIV